MIAKNANLFFYDAVTLQCLWDSAKEGQTSYGGG
jgi:hypothetical protein